MAAEDVPELVARIEALSSDNARLLTAKKAAERAAQQAKELEVKLCDAEVVIAGLKAENRSCGDMAVVAERAAKVAKKALAEKERLLVELQKQSEQTDAAAKALQSVNTTLLQRCKSKDAALAQLQDDAGRKEDTVRRLEDENAALLQALAEIRAGAERTALDAMQLLSAKEALQEDLRDSVYEARALQSECMKLEKEVSFSRQESKMAKSSLDSRESDLAVSRVELHEARSEIAMLQVAIEELRGSCLSAKSETREMQARQREMRRNAHKPRPVERALRRKADALEAERVALRATNDELVGRLREARNTLEASRERAAEDLVREKDKGDALLRRVASLERERERDASAAMEQLSASRAEMRAEQKALREHKSALKRLNACLHDECKSLRVEVEEGARQLLIEQANTAAVRAKYNRALMQQGSGSPEAVLGSSATEANDEWAAPCHSYSPAADAPSPRLSRPFAVRHLSKWVGEPEISFSHSQMDSEEYEDSRARARERAERRARERSEQGGDAAPPYTLSVADIDPWCDGILTLTTHDVLHE